MQKKILTICLVLSLVAFLAMVIVCNLRPEEEKSVWLFSASGCCIAAMLFLVLSSGRRSAKRSEETEAKRQALLRRVREEKLLLVLSFSGRERRVCSPSKWDAFAVTLFPVCDRSIPRAFLYGGKGLEEAESCLISDLELFLEVEELNALRGRTIFLSRSLYEAMHPSPLYAPLFAQNEVIALDRSV